MRCAETVSRCDGERRQFDYLPHGRAVQIHEGTSCYRHNNMGIFSHSYCLPGRRSTTIPGSFRTCNTHLTAAHSSVSHRTTRYARASQTVRHSHLIFSPYFRSSFTMDSLATHLASSERVARHTPVASSVHTPWLRYHHLAHAVTTQFAAAWSPTSSSFATASADGTVKYWDPATKASTRTIVVGSGVNGQQVR